MFYNKNMEAQLTKKKIVNNYIKEKIAEGELKAGDPIPTEMQLINLFGFGRQTIHNCLNELAIEGVIERTAGKGSFVSQDGAQRSINKRRSFTEEMKALGMKPGSKILEYRIIKANENPKIMQLLNLNEDDDVHYISRLRTANDSPREIQYSYTPVKYLKEIDITKLSGSFDVYMREHGLVAPNFVTKIKVIKSKLEEKKLLKTTNDYILRSTSIRYNKKKVPVQCTYSMINCDTYEYTFSSFENE